MTLKAALDLAPRLARARWTWTTEVVDGTLAALGYRFEGVDGDFLRYRGSSGAEAIVRHAKGSVQSVAFLLARSVSPDELEDEDAMWDDVAGEMDEAFEATARALQETLGPPSFTGTPPRGPTWDTWAGSVVLWPAATAWTTLQLRQDDTDVPIELLLLCAPPGHLRVQLRPAPLPERAREAPPQVAPSPPAAPLHSPVDDADDDDLSLVEALAAQALALKREQRWDEAIEVMTQVTALSPGWGAAWNDLGTIYAAKRATDEARACFDRAVAVDPSLIEMVSANRVRARKEAGTMRARYDALVAKHQAGQCRLEEIYELAWVLRWQGHAALARDVFKIFVARATPPWAGVAAKVRAWLAAPPA